MKFHDIIVTEDFIEDWTDAPSIVKGAVDRKIRQLALEHTFRPSANLHRVREFPELWIHHLPNGQGAWRMILTVKEEKLYLIELLDHQTMMRKYS